MPSLATGREIRTKSRPLLILLVTLCLQVSHPSTDLTALYTALNFIIDVLKKAA